MFLMLVLNNLEAQVKSWQTVYVKPDTCRIVPVWVLNELNAEVYRSRRYSEELQKADLQIDTLKSQNKSYQYKNDKLIENNNLQLLIINEKDSIIDNKQQQITIYKKKEKRSKLFKWVERAGWGIIIGLIII
jgi:hypothetical protein